MRGAFFLRTASDMPFLPLVDATTLLLMLFDADAVWRGLICAICLLSLRAHIAATRRYKKIRHVDATPRRLF